jgi:N-terminal 7TM region of histidine kinase
VRARIDLRRTAPWVLCAVALGLFVLGNVCRWSLRDDVPGPDIGWVEGTIGALGFAGIPIVGALIASRLPTNPYGWLWCAAGLAYAVSDVAEPLVRVLEGPLWIAWILSSWGFVSLIGLFVFVFLLFPTGRLPSDRWRWLARAAVTGAVLLVLAVPFVTDPDERAPDSPWAVEGDGGEYLLRFVVAGIYVMFGIGLTAMFSLVMRFRRADPVERRQLTWFLYATAVNAVLLIIDTLGVTLTGLVDATVSAAGFAFLPVAVGIAVFRYRLFEIDRIVSRTVSYGLLTATLIGLYLLVVALLRPLLEPLTGNSNLAVAASTLAVAAAFNPVRRRLQATVDRRFDRARYDAARAVDAFAARLRDQVDLDEVTAGLRDAVAATVAPSRVAVWLRASSGTGGG